MYEDDFQIILDRMKPFLKEEKDAGLARALGITPQALSQFRKSNKFPYDLLIKFCLKHQLIIDWLLRGEGAKFRWEVKAYEEKICESAEGYHGKRIEVFAFAGAGLPMNPDEYEPVEELFIPTYLWSAAILPVRVQGRSMEPTIMDNALVGIDRDDKWVVSGEVYAVWMPYEGAVIKRLYLDMEKITLKSDNPAFADIFAPLEGLQDHFIQGRVKWVIQAI